MWITNRVNSIPSGQNTIYKGPVGGTCYVGKTARRKLAGRKW